MPRFAAAVRLIAVHLLVVVCASWVTSPATVGAQEVEEFLSYDVAITLEPGGAMDVTEVLSVRALCQQIRRGIFRDFPTGFPRAAGLGPIEAPFEVVSVHRDGSPEPFHVEAIGGELGRSGMRVLATRTSPAGTRISRSASDRRFPYPGAAPRSSIRRRVRSPRGTRTACRS